MASRSYATMARQYARDVAAGKMPACKWVRAACQRQIDDLDRYKGKDSPYRFNPKLTDKQGRSFYPADNLCAFIERLPHVKGPLAGQLIRLEPWQVFILTTVFGWVKPDGKRRFRRSYIEVPRGNAKSTLSSALALYMLAADAAVWLVGNGIGASDLEHRMALKHPVGCAFGNSQSHGDAAPISLVFGQQVIEVITLDHFERGLSGKDPVGVL